MRRCRNVGAHSLVTSETLSVGIILFNHFSAPPLFLLTAGLPSPCGARPHHIAGYLALIRFGGSLLAHFGGKLTDFLLVDTGNDDLVGSRNINGDAVDFFDVNRVRETEAFICSNLPCLATR